LVFGIAGVFGRPSGGSGFLGVFGGVRQSGGLRHEAPPTLNPPRGTSRRGGPPSYLFALLGLSQSLQITLARLYSFKSFLIVCGE
jgi:hypothetical protein